MIFHNQIHMDPSPRIFTFAFTFVIMKVINSENSVFRFALISVHWRPQRGMLLHLFKIQIAGVFPFFLEASRTQLAWALLIFGGIATHLYTASWGQSRSIFEFEPSGPSRQKLRYRHHSNPHVRIAAPKHSSKTISVMYLHSELIAQLVLEKQFAQWLREFHAKTIPQELFHAIDCNNFAPSLRK